MAIEDSPTGVASALASGAAVLAVPAEVALPSTVGVHQVESLTGVDLALLAALLTRSGWRRPADRPARVGGAGLPTGRVQWRSAKTAATTW